MTADMTSKWHGMTTEEVLKNLNVGKGGLSDEEAQQRLQKFGYNELVEAKKTTLLQIFLNQFKDVFVIMLIVATAISFAIGETVDALTIAAIVVLNGIVGFIQEYRSEKAMEAMKKLTAPKARVLRDGKEKIVPAKEVVPGDIALLEAGDRVPADGRLIEVVEFKTDEAVLTGESTPVNKTLEPVTPETPVADRKNTIFMATHAIYGRAKAAIIQTGMKTEFGKIAEMVQSVEEEETPLRKKLEKFAKKLGILIVVVCAVIFVLELYELYNLGIIHTPEALSNILNAFETAVALAVSAVPEGLPAVVTVSLALGARELAKKNAIIRKLTSAETLGATTVICSDKTGTLTKGEMTVRKIYGNGKMLDVSGAGYESKGEFHYRGETIDPKQDSVLATLLRVATLSTNAQYDGKSIIGDPTEGALIVVATKTGMQKGELERAYPRVREIPFTSERKLMTTAHQTPENELFAYVKGAPETVLERCTHVLSDGKENKLTEKERKIILKKNEEMASEALRVLGMAYQKITAEKIEKLSDEEIESKLVFAGLMGMIDPPREEAKAANELCQKAGIRTVMITGDHKLTAVAIAKELGMLRDGMVLTGQELDKLGDQEFEDVVEKVTVYARVAPEHKIRIVRALKKKGHIVAMTGDGVNDAPALKQADIGVAMGITGTDVTREAADMVLADDNFATIVTAVKGGRTIYDNIRKFSFFLLRCNFDELALIGTFALLGLEIPLTAGMILWLNLVTDGGPALALTMDPPEKDVMDRPPRDPNEGVLHGRLASIITTFTLQFLLTGGIFYWQFYHTGAYLLPEPMRSVKLADARTMAFMRATLQELLVVWNCRSERRNAFRVGFRSNKFLLGAVIGCALITLAVPYIGLFGTIPIDDPFEWGVVILASMSGLLILPEVFYGRKIWRWR